MSSGVGVTRDPRQRVQVKSPETFTAIRRERGLTITEMARTAGISKGFLSMVARRIQGCSRADAERITHALNRPGEPVLAVEVLFTARATASTRGTPQLLETV